MKAKIVETEAYLGINDRACHTLNNNKTERNKILYMDCGTLYVYKKYGIHFLLNISSVGENILGKNLYLEDSNYDFEISTDRRVGIDYAKEARDYPYRFFIKNNQYISKNIQE